MIGYRIILVIKLAGVLVYAGGLIASFVARSIAERRQAVHRIASPGLLVTWAAGYLLTTQLNISMLELWILGALVLSLVSQVSVVYSVSRERPSTMVYVTTFVPLFLVLVLMVFRPTWSLLRT